MWDYGCILLNARVNNDGPQLTWLRSSEGPMKLCCQHHLWVRSILPLITDQSVGPSLLRRCLDLPSLSTLHTPLFSCLHIVALSSPSLMFTLFSSLFYIPLVLLSISLPTCSASVSQWLSEEVLHSVGNLPLAMIRWVREQINSRSINRIFASFHQPLLTGYS